MRISNKVICLILIYSADIYSAIYSYKFIVKEVLIRLGLLRKFLKRILLSFKCNLLFKICNRQYDAFSLSIRIFRLNSRGILKSFAYLNADINFVIALQTRINPLETNFSEAREKVAKKLTLFQINFCFYTAGKLQCQ